MIEYINHITLTTGHIRKSYPDEIDSSLYFALHGIFKEAQKPEGVSLFDGFNLQILAEKSKYVATLFFGELIPVLTTAGSLHDDKELISLMHETASTPIVMPKDMIKIAPFTIDRIEAGVTQISPKEKIAEVMSMTGDLCRCIGWFMLAPKQVR